MISVMFYLPHLDGGGAEMNAVRLAHGLLQEGIQPTYVVTHGPGGYAKYLPPEVEVVVLSTGSLRSSTARLVRSLYPLKRLVEAKRPDILCPVMPLPSLVAVAAVALSSHRPRIALSIQSTIRPPGRPTYNLVKIVERLLLPLVLPSADSVLALSQGVGNEIELLIPRLKGRVAIIHNIGLPLDMQLSEHEPNPPTQPENGRVRFLACGRLVEAKGYPYLLRAFSEVRKSVDAELHILGAGRMEPELEKLSRQLEIDDRVTFLGFRRNPYVHMRGADIFVLSSLWEGFGNVIIEAMSEGTPVIATRCPSGPEEIITDEVNGLLVPPRDSDSLANAMERLALDKALQSRLASAGRQRSRDFSPGNVSREYARAFRCLLDRADRAPHAPD
jgi:glycosyltransferase involved in cell wall biosynthesis